MYSLPSAGARGQAAGKSEVWAAPYHLGSPRPAAQRQHQGQGQGPAARPPASDIVLGCWGPLGALLAPPARGMGRAPEVHAELGELGPVKRQISEGGRWEDSWVPFQRGSSVVFLPLTQLSTLPVACGRNGEKLWSSLISGDARVMQGGGQKECSPRCGSLPAWCSSGLSLPCTLLPSRPFSHRQRLLHSVMCTGWRRLALTGRERGWFIPASSCHAHCLVHACGISSEGMDKGRELLSHPEVSGRCGEGSLI